MKIINKKQILCALLLVGLVTQPVSRAKAEVQVNKGNVAIAAFVTSIAVICIWYAKKKFNEFKQRIRGHRDVLRDAKRRIPADPVPLRDDEEDLVPCPETQETDLTVVDPAAGQHWGIWRTHFVPGGSWLNAHAMSGDANEQAVWRQLLDDIRLGRITIAWQHAGLSGAGRIASAHMIATLDDIVTSLGQEYDALMALIRACNTITAKEFSRHDQFGQEQTYMAGAYNYFIALCKVQNRRYNGPIYLAEFTDADLLEVVRALHEKCHKDGSGYFSADEARNYNLAVAHMIRLITQAARVAKLREICVQHRADAQERAAVAVHGNRLLPGLAQAIASLDLLNANITQQGVVQLHAVVQGLRLMLGNPLPAQQPATIVLDAIVRQLQALSVVPFNLVAAQGQLPVIRGQLQALQAGERRNPQFAIA